MPKLNSRLHALLRASLLAAPTLKPSSGDFPDGLAQTKNRSKRCPGPVFGAAGRLAAPNARKQFSPHLPGRVPSGESCSWLPMPVARARGWDAAPRRTHRLTHAHCVRR